MSDQKKPTQGPVDPQLEAAYAMKAAAERMIAAIEGKSGKRPAPMVSGRASAPPAPVEPPPPPPKPLTLRDRIANTLMTETLDTNKLSKALGEPVDVVAGELAKARADGSVTNIGYDDAPLWVWKPGDGIDTPSLKKMIRRRSSERPMWIKDLIHLTGARPSRVDGVMTEIKRNEKLVDMAGGAGRPGRPEAKLYFLPTAEWKVDGGQDASLEARPTTREGRKGKGIKPRAPKHR